MVAAKTPRHALLASLRCSSSRYAERRNFHTLMICYAAHKSMEVFFLDRGASPPRLRAPPKPRGTHTRSRATVQSRLSLAIRRVREGVGFARRLVEGVRARRLREGEQPPPICLRQISTLRVRNDRGVPPLYPCLFAVCMILVVSPTFMHDFTCGFACVAFPQVDGLL